jgi:hypothetical protein
VDNAKLTLTFGSTHFPNGDSSSISLTSLRDHYWKEGYKAAAKVAKVSEVTTTDNSSTAKAKIVTVTLPTESESYGSTPSTTKTITASSSYTWTGHKYDPETTEPKVSTMAGETFKVIKKGSSHSSGTITLNFSMNVG